MEKRKIKENKLKLCSFVEILGMMKNQLYFLTFKYFEQYQQNIASQSLVLPEIEKSRETGLSLEKYSFYLVSSAVYSANIEGNSISIDTYMRHLDSQHLKRTRDVKEIEDLIKAYQFAQNKPLTIKNLLKAHQILSKSFLIKSSCGKLRTQPVAVYREQKLEYLAVEPEYVPLEMDKLFADIAQALKISYNLTESLYLASFIHLVFLKIHPFMDGNGRTARLLEKWFLAEKFGQSIWQLETEKYYHQHKTVYYKNVHIGGNYYVLNYDICLPFLLMLPKIVEEK